MKKVLSLVLVLTLVLGSFSMAFAGTDAKTTLSDVEGNANAGAIVVANDLGIVTGYNDGTFKPANAVTRAEFAAMMTRALAIPESALAGFKTSTFTDVTADHWAVAYLGYCNSKGIMTGYEDGTARPNQTITVNEAMTMVCRALGYVAQAKELVGTWPANYISLAQQLGLYDDMAAVGTIDRASAAQVIYNALTVPTVYINADGDTAHVNGGTLANPVDVSMLTKLGGDEENGGYGFVLDSTKAETAVININEYVGSFVKAFNDGDDIIAVEVLSTTVTGDYDAAKKIISTDDVDYYFNAADYDYTSYDAVGGKYANTTPEYVVNGKTTTAAIPGLVDGNTYTFAAKISGKTITEVYSVIEWTAVAIDQFEADDLNVEKAKINVGGTDYNFKTDKNGDIDMSSFALVGVSALDKIAEDNIVQVYVDGGYITKLAVGTETVTGEVTEINKAGTKFTINGTKYEATNAASPAVGETGTAYLTFGGDIAVWDVDDATVGNYAVFLGQRPESGTTLSSGYYMVGLVLKDGTVKEYKLSSSATVTGAGVTTVTAIGLNSIVNYSFNKSGEEITKLVSIANAGITGNVNTGKTRIGNTKFANNVVVFEVDDNGDWTIGDVNNFDTDYAFSGTNCYAVTNAKSQIEAIRVDKEDVLGSEANFGVITSLSKRNNDGTVTWYVKGFVDGAAFEGFSDDTSSDTLMLASTVGATGLYKITIDADGTVSAVDSTPTVSDKALGLIVKSVDKTINEVTVSGGAVYGLTDDVAVYYYDEEDGYVLSSVDKIGKGKNIDFVATGKAAWEDQLYNVVIFWDAE